MLKRYWLLLALAAFACSKSDNSRFPRRQKTAATSYTGSLLTTTYQYDGQNRISSILKKKDSAAAAVAVTITYNGTEALLVSYPDTDPAYNQKTELLYLLDAEGKPIRRLGFTQLTSKAGPGNESREYRNDTTLYEYDAANLLVKSTRKRRDWLWMPPGNTIVRTFTSVITYTNGNGNLLSTVENIVYLITTTQLGNTTLSGGNSTYRKSFDYSKAYPNKTDFKNAFVLNEYLDFYEPLINEHYKHMPDRIKIDNRDWDLNGNLIFQAGSSFEMKRLYDENGLLSTLSIPAGNTQDTLVRYYYERY